MKKKLVSRKSHEKARWSETGSGGVRPSYTGSGRPSRKAASRRGTFRIDCEVINIREPERSLNVPRLLIDSGSEYTWIPAPLLEQIGIQIEEEEQAFLKANGKTLTRSIGFAKLRIGGFLTVDEAVFGQPGDLAMLGAHTLEGFGAVVDARRKILIEAGPYPAAPSLRVA